MSATITTYDAFLKENYGNKDRIQELLYKDFPFLGYITKKTGASNASGDTLIAPVIYGGPQGLSATRANAQTAAAASGGSTQAKRWVVNFGQYSASVVFEDKLMKLSTSDNGAYLEAKKLEIDNMYTSWSQVFSTYLLGSKTRNLGGFTLTSGGVATLAVPENIVNFSPGMLLQASADDGSATSHALLGSGSIGYVISVNSNAGTFTVSATDGGSGGVPTSWSTSATNYAFRYGDFGGTTTPETVCDGFGDWCPATDPTAGTTFNNIDRATAIIPFSGVRLTSTEIAGQPLEWRIKRLVSRMATRGFGAPDAVFLNPEKWQDLADALESRGIRDNIGKDATFGYQTIRVSAGGTFVDVYSDRYVPLTAVCALRKGAFALHTPEEFPAVINGDGLTMLRKATSDDYEYRLKAYPATLATPGYLGRTTAP